MIVPSLSPSKANRPSASVLIFAPKLVVAAKLTGLVALLVVRRQAGHDDTRQLRHDPTRDPRGGDRHEPVLLTGPGGDETLVLHGPVSQPDGARAGPDEQHAAVGGRHRELETGVGTDGPECERTAGIGPRDVECLLGASRQDLAADIV